MQRPFFSQSPKRVGSGPGGPGTSPDDIKKKVPCGPDAERVADAIREYVEIGFDEVYISQMGGRDAATSSQGFFDFYARDVLPKLKA